MQTEPGIESRMEHATSSLRRAGEETAASIKQQGEKYMEEAKEGWDDFTEDIKEKGKMVKQRVEEASKYTDKYAHENPWHVVGVAAAIGAFVALLVSGRRRD